jgi:hypothetical protein
METRQKFDDIFQQLTFGVKATKNAYRPVGDENKLPLRQLPKEDPPARKRRKLKNDTGLSNEDGGNFGFWNSSYISFRNQAVFRFHDYD